MSTRSDWHDAICVTNTLRTTSAVLLVLFHARHSPGSLWLAALLLPNADRLVLTLKAVACAKSGWCASHDMIHLRRGNHGFINPNPNPNLCIN